MASVIPHHSQSTATSGKEERLAREEAFKVAKAQAAVNSFQESVRLEWLEHSVQSASKNREQLTDEIYKLTVEFLRNPARKTLDGMEAGIKYRANKNFFLAGEKLYCKARGVYKEREVLTAERFLDEMITIHLQLDHAGRDKMFPILKARFHGVDRNSCQWVIDHCEYCCITKTASSKIPLKPIIGLTGSERFQINLIDIRYERDGQFKWVLHIKDHYSKLTRNVSIQDPFRSLTADILVPELCKKGCGRDLRQLSPDSTEEHINYCSGINKGKGKEVSSTTEHSDKQAGKRKCSTREKEPDGNTISDSGSDRDFDSEPDTKSFDDGAKGLPGSTKTHGLHIKIPVMTRVLKPKSPKAKDVPQKNTKLPNSTKAPYIDIKKPAMNRALESKYPKTKDLPPTNTAPLQEKVDSNAKLPVPEHQHPTLLHQSNYGVWRTGQRCKTPTGDAKTQHVGDMSREDKLVKKIAMERAPNAGQKSDGWAVSLHHSEVRNYFARAGKLEEWTPPWGMFFNIDTGYVERIEGREIEPAGDGYKVVAPIDHGTRLPQGGRYIGPASDGHEALVPRKQSTWLQQVLRPGPSYYSVGSPHAVDAAETGRKKEVSMIETEPEG